MNNKIAIRPNELIEAYYSLSAKQLDLIDMVFCQVIDDHNNCYTLDVNDYKSLYDNNSSQVYRNLQKAAESFEGKGFYLLDKKSNKRTFFSWFSSIQYLNNEGRVTLEIGGKLKELLLLSRQKEKEKEKEKENDEKKKVPEIKNPEDKDVSESQKDNDKDKKVIKQNKKIIYEVAIPFNLQSSYSKRFYYYIKSFLDTGWRIDNLDVLREKLECPPSYAKYSIFKQKVLDVAYKEINEKTDIRFEYEVIKEKNKVVKIKYYITSNINKKVIAVNFDQPVKNIDPKVIDEEDVEKPQQIAKGVDFKTIDESRDEEIERVMAIFTKHTISAKQAKELLFDANFNLDKISEVYEYALTQSVNYIFPYMKALLKKFKKPNSDKLKSTKGHSIYSKFNDFEQRAYDGSDGGKTLSEIEELLRR